MDEVIVVKKAIKDLGLREIRMITKSDGSITLMLEFLLDKSSGETISFRGFSEDNQELFGCYKKIWGQRAMFSDMSGIGVNMYVIDLKGEKDDKKDKNNKKAHKFSDLTSGFIPRKKDGK